MSYLLEVENLKVELGNRLVLEDISFGLRSGEIHVLFGPNGSGKTTIVGAIAGLPMYRVVSGRILFMNEDITNKSVEERAKLGISVGFQNPPEITGVKLEDLLKLCLGKSQKYEFSMDEMRLIESFRLKDFLKRETNVGFSGGERKRSEILQLLFLKPKLLLLDEPDSGVDVESLKLIASEIQQYIDSSGASALIITHKGDILDYINAKYGCVLLNGKIHCFADPSRVFNDIKREGYEGCVKCQLKGEEKW
jgi:Fe-S cluster assembly ATP-binding protein